MSNELILVNQQTKAVELSAPVVGKIMELLADASLIGKVTTDEQNTTTFGLQKSLATFKKLIEDNRKQSNAEPQKRIDETNAACKKFNELITEEITRLGRISGDFQAAQRARIEAEELRKRAELDKIEKERLEKVAACGDDLDKVDAANEAASRAQAKAQADAKPIARAPGQKFEEKWNFEVTNIFALQQMYPSCVKMTEKRSEITELLKAGVTLPGVRAWKENVSGVSRVNKTTELNIE